MFGYFRRRFSSGDIQGEGEEEQQQQQQQPTPPPPQPQIMTQQPSMSSGQPMNRKGPSPSAPTSPSKSSGGSGGVNPFAGGGLASQIGLGRSIFGKTPYNKDRCKNLLVIDESHTDWSKYFRNRKIMTDWDVRVEQATFNEIRLAANTRTGCTVELIASGDPSGGRVTRNFKPDFVLVRQHVRDADQDWRPIIIGFMHAGVPTVNSAMALFNCAERAWLFANMAQIQNRIGSECFPLIEQHFFPGYLDVQLTMRQKKVNQTLAQENFPIAMKIGHGHSGLGKIKLTNLDDYQDACGILGVSKVYATTETLIDAKFDIHVQKIGTNYKAYVRRSISGNWKANISSAMLEQLPVTDKFRQWVDEVSHLFGGLDICSVETVQHKNGRVFIIEANGSDMPLMGDSQEEDRRAIAELTLSRMHHACSEAAALQRSRGGYANGPSGQSGESLGSGRFFQQQQQQQQQQQSMQQQQRSSGGSMDEGDDTMRNLRKTFAGIFGDM